MNMTGSNPGRVEVITSVERRSRWAPAEKDGEVVQNPMMDELFQENETITAAACASTAGKIAFEKNAGNLLTRIGSGFGYFEEVPLAKGKRCFSVNGFSLHCNTAANIHARDRLEGLIEYIL